MRRSLRLLGLALGMLLCQALATTAIQNGPRPDLILIFALAMGLRSGGTGSLVLSFLMGFSVDVLSGSPMGLYAMLRGTACAATRVFDSTLYVRAPLPWAVYVAGYTIFDGILLGAVLRTLAPESAVAWPAILFRLPLTVLMTTVLAIPLLSLVRRWDLEAQGDGDWTTLASRRSRP
jgi:rod shape-determining protein MreD